MTNHLFIGDYTYSSWSLRGWLLLHRFGIPFQSQMVDFNQASVAEQMAAHVPARTVPTLVTDTGDVIWDSLAIAEEMATRHPEAGIWPRDTSLRTLARGLTCEMHSGFMTLRGDCPMHLRVAYQDVPVSDALQADLDRIEVIWEHAIETSGGPWLAGDYSAADAFFAPVAARIAGYGLTVGDTARAYVQAHLNDPAFRQWRAMGLVQGDMLPWYARDYTQVDWPGPKPLSARAVADGTPENAACPYSGKEPTHLMEIGGRIFGFCNPGCRDKTVADPEAWPAFMALMNAR
ncbi:MAG: glutathione S-transferase family protein [Pelagimonas sp.]|nr:glutathione S-transferase family protein [Pelagimonas sp.]